MTLRVDDILRSPGLALQLVGGRSGKGSIVRWVHVSELEDPTPWLKGGELLLTTGMGVGRSAAKQRSYLRRLADAELAGLGFGTGFSFTKVPKAIRDAADELGFPVFEVPYAVPFIAITEMVFSRAAGEQVEILQRSIEAQTALTRAVIDGEGVDGVVRELAGVVGGWAVILELHGVALATAPASAARRTARLWEEIQARRADGPGFSLSLVDRGDHVSIQPVGARGHVEAFLAVGKGEALSQLDRVVAAHAVSLVAIELDRRRAVVDTERRLRGDFLDALVRGELSARKAAEGLHRFGFERTDEVAVLALESPFPVEDLLWAAEDVLSRRGGGYLTAPREQDLYVLVHPDGEEGFGELRREVAGKLRSSVRLGAGSAVRPTQAGTSLREASYALKVARLEGRDSADFRALGTYRLLLSLQEPDALRAFADSVLAPLDRYDADHGGELVPSLRAFLEHNARWESAAGELFVHRHTLRYRMRKVEELAGRDLGSAHDRMEFWLALRARDLLRETERPAS
ncbi:MAG TPA: PucR family transcriptional regulator ligand-binding domain-containing protein [Actinomycetota bacterium]